MASSRPDPETVIRNFEKWLRLKAMDLTPDRHLQQDLMQLGRIAIWKAVDTFDESKGALPSWVQLKARGAMLDSFRKQIDLPLESEAEEWDKLRTELHASDLAAHQREIRAAIDTLSPRQQEYVHLRFFEDYREAELREHFGYDPGGLWRSPKNGARNKLRDQLSHLQRGA